MKVLVTGALGQLGREIKDIEREFPFLDIAYTGVDTLDVTDKRSLEEFFRAEKPNMVLNCAAYTAVDRAESNSEKAGVVNRDAVRNLAEVCKELGSFMIHFSTDYVFDGTSYRPYIEEDPTGPISVYGKTKMEGENELIHSGIKYIIIRTSWLYSTYGNNFVKRMIELGKEREELKVVSDQVGVPTSAADLAKVVLTIVAKTVEDGLAFVPGIYHYANAGVASWYDFALAIHELYGNMHCKVLPVTTKDYPVTVQRPHYSVLDNTKIRGEFNVDIPHWRSSLKKVIEKLK